MSNPHICSPPFYCRAKYACVAVPVAVMRADPSDKSEVVSQAIFSEAIRIIDKTVGWAKVETVVDGYVGWMKRGDYHVQKEMACDPKKSSGVMVSRPAAHIYHTKDTIYGPLMTVPFESRLEVSLLAENHDDRWIEIVLPNKKKGYIQRGDVIETPKSRTPLGIEEMCLFSRSFLGLPYTWGGRSSFGYDCSGFTQMLYRQMGISLPRDAVDQCHWKGFTPVSPDKVRPGNLVFFGTGEDHIRHVGLCLGNNEFIHATVAENQPYIHISSLSDPKWSGSGEWPFRRFTSL